MRRRKSNTLYFLRVRLHAGLPLPSSPHPRTPTPSHYAHPTTRPDPRRPRRPQRESQPPNHPAWPRRRRCAWQSLPLRRRPRLPGRHLWQVRRFRGVRVLYLCAAPVRASLSLTHGALPPSLHFSENLPPHPRQPRPPPRPHASRRPRPPRTGLCPRHPRRSAPWACRT